MLKTSKKLKGRKDIDEHLIYILRKSTPYQRMVWLKKAFEFWKSLKKEKEGIKVKIMKIVICGSMYFAKEMLEVKAGLEEMGHFCFVPSDINDCVKNPELSMDMEHCLRTNVQKECFDKIKESDAILVLNYKRNGIKGYIGGATLMEIGIAQCLDKKIFLLYPPPKIEDLRYSLEIQLAKPIILNGDLSLIK